jgi:hypothetical protein
MVATGDLKSPVFGRAGSTPATRTNNSELPERPIGASWKDDGRESGTRVRISHSLPKSRQH